MEPDYQESQEGRSPETCEDGIYCVFRILREREKSIEMLLTMYPSLLRSPETLYFQIYYYKPPLRHISHSSIHPHGLLHCVPRCVFISIVRGFPRGPGFAWGQ